MPSFSSNQSWCCFPCHSLFLFLWWLVFWTCQLNSLISSTTLRALLLLKLIYTLYSFLIHEFKQCLHSLLPFTGRFKNSLPSSEFPFVEYQQETTLTWIDYSFWYLLQYIFVAVGYCRPSSSTILKFTLPMVFFPLRVLFDSHTLLKKLICWKSQSSILKSRLKYLQDCVMRIMYISFQLKSNWIHCIKTKTWREVTQLTWSERRTLSLFTWSAFSG